MAVSGTAPGHPPRGPVLPGTGHHGIGTRDLGRLLIGLVVVAVGVLYLLDAADALDAGSVIADWWPSLVVALGAFQLADRAHGVAGPLVLMGLGGFLLMLTTGAIGEASWAYIWPALVVAGGLFILFRWVGAGRLPRTARDEDTIVATGILGGPRASTSSQAFQGGSLTAVLGGVTLDLRGALPVPEGARVNATAVLGGVDVLVPEGWRVTVSGTPILGGVADRTTPRDDLPAGAPRLHVDAVAVLGGVDVKHPEPGKDDG